MLWLLCYTPVANWCDVTCIDLNRKWKLANNRWLLLVDPYTLIEQSKICNY